MATIILSTRANEADPALAPWLAGAGLHCGIVPAAAPAPRQPPRILHEDERALAGPRDLLIALEDGAPHFRPAANGLPAHIRFGTADLAFGHALIAEHVRPVLRPACGEPASAALLATAERIAATSATVLVLGETGTGKEGIARFVHACSPRRDAAFVAVNCAALPEAMLEAMLFGHQKGSFTGAAAASEGLFRAADGGTLLLDEVAEMPLALQAKLLRAIQEREVLPIGATRPVPVDVRIVAAANRDLAAEVAAGRFRADLYWRLNVLPLTLPPLASRRLDIRAIAAALIVRHAPAGQPFPWLAPDALVALMAHAWPGNVRELENVIQRAVLFRAGERIEAADLQFAGAPVLSFAAAAPVHAAPPAPAAARSDMAPVARLADAARDTLARTIRDALAATGGHRVRTAELLGISERTLRYRLADLRANDMSLAA